MNNFTRTQAELLCHLEISKVLNSSFRLLENLNTALKLLSDYLDMRRGTVTFFEGTSGELRIVAASGLTLEQISKGRYKVGEGMVGRVFETGEPLIVPNIGKEPLFLNRTGARIDKNNISFLCVLIKLNEEILGLLSAAIPEALLEAELFGYEKGAYTGAFSAKPGKVELANGGILFLDEIGDMPYSSSKASSLSLGPNL